MSEPTRLMRPVQAIRTVGPVLAVFALVAGAFLAVSILCGYRRFSPSLAIGFCAFALFQALPWLNVADDQGLAYRLRLAAHACLAPCAALLAQISGASSVVTVNVTPNCSGNTTGTAWDLTVGCPK